MTTTEDTGSTGDDIRAQLREWAEKLKAEIADRIDQALDELGARIGG